MSVAVIGAGAFGTALAVNLAGRGQVTLWGRDTGWAREREKAAADQARERFEFRNFRQEREKAAAAELRQRLAQVEEQSFSATWVYGLGGLLALAVGCIGWLLRRARRTLSSSIRRVLHSFHGFCARPMTTVSAFRQRNSTRWVAGIWRKMHSSTARLNQGS